MSIRRIPIRMVAAAATALALAGAVAAAATSGSAAKSGTARDLSALSGTWKVLSSATATQTGQQISTPGFNTGSWLTVKPDDAGAPGTEINALLQNGKCPNVFFATTMKSCFGTGSNGAIKSGQFAVPWWYRKEFEVPKHFKGRTVWLAFHGINYRGEIWINGKAVETNETAPVEDHEPLYGKTYLPRKFKTGLALPEIRTRPGPRPEALRQRRPGRSRQPGACRG